MSEQKEEPNKGGRPEFEPTPEQRDQVEISVYCGMTHAAIAASLRISTPTLRKHFEDELLYGHSRKEAEAFQLLFESARKGNVSAQKHVQRLGSMVAPAGAPQPSPTPDQQPPARKSDDPGKKEMLNAAARQPPAADSKWSGLLN